MPLDPLLDLLDDDDDDDDDDGDGGSCDGVGDYVRGWRYRPKDRRWMDIAGR